MRGDTRRLAAMALLILLTVSSFVAGCFSPREQTEGGEKAASLNTPESKASRAGVRIPPMPADGNYDCADFETRAQARAVLERDPSDPHYLDGEGDGIPCEELPPGDDSPGASPPSPDSSPAPASAPAVAAGAPAPPSPQEASSMLDGLTVAAPGSMAGYSREEFPHWASDGTEFGWNEPEGSCDVRDDALVRDGRGVAIDSECAFTSGAWLDPYTGQTLRDSSDVDIDHIVPLANAWRSGASSSEWSTAEREAYANDPGVLLSADATANRTKGDKGPEAWKPPNRAYWCEYARRWIWIKDEWRLNINPTEKSALREMLATCGEG